MHALAFLLVALFIQDVDVDDEAPAAASGTSQEQKFPKFEDVVKGLQAKKAENGKFILHHKENRLLWEIPSDMLQQPFLFASSFARGRYSGWMWDDRLVQWQKMDKKLLLIEPDVRHRANSDDPLALSVKRQYTESILATADIVTMSPQGGVVIDLFALLTQNTSVFVGGYSFGSSLAKVHKVKVFPSNMEIEIDMPSRRMGPIETVHFSISTLKETGYRARAADDRIGYFLTAVKDYSKSAKDDTRFVRYINRWHIEKADRKLKLSPPKEPIVFYVEKTVPVQYRRAVREGILEWNKAFEKIGISEAIVVRQQTANNEFATLDPEDVRYNFFRWITSDWAFAMGPSRVDPRTGQILDADIIFDDAMIRAYIHDHKLMIGETARARLSPAQRQYLKSRPQLDPMRHELAGNAKRFQDAISELEERASLGMFEGDGRRACALARGRMQQMTMAQLAGLALMDAESDEKWPEDFISQVIKETVMHEVGHTLGLRHNFKASSWRSLDEVNTENGPADTSGSVMDYNPLNLALDPKKQGRFSPTTIGPYDYWAIEYGYKPFDGDEKAELAKVAQRVAEKGLAYGTDEDLWSSDPQINTWDFGDDALAFAEHRIKLVEGIQKNLLDRAVKKGDSYAAARRAFLALISERMQAGSVAARYVGGHHTHRDHRGDPNERAPIVPVDPDKQRQALAFLKEHVFSDQAFQFPPEFLNQLGASRWNHWGGEFDWDVEFPVHSIILSAQSWALFDLLYAETLQRIQDAELRIPSDKDAFTLAELFTQLTASICAEIVDGPKGGASYTERRPFISSLRRNLQREYIAQLITISLEREDGWSFYSRTARTMTWYELKRLQDRLDALLQKAPAIDRYSAAHLEECRQRIRRALEASFSLSGGDGASGIFGSD